MLVRLILQMGLILAVEISALMEAGLIFRDLSEIYHVTSFVMKEENPIEL